MTDPRRRVPSVGALLERDYVRALLDIHPRSVVVDAIRRATDEVRARDAYRVDENWSALIASQIAEIEKPGLRPVFNATGVILHTNLGRAPLADVAVAAIENVARGYTNLEYEVEQGTRGSRYSHCVSLLCELTGAEDALVVNNCAASLVLALSALARGREVIISRGELVEIGGSFRVPDIMARSGATLVEVGTTNRTHLDDYARSISSRTGAIAKVHRSNFSQSGYVADVPVESIVPIAREHDTPIVHDLGSGLLIDLSGYGLSDEPTARVAISQGATLILMSGDKLLGGPQAGIVLGKRHAIARMKQDPLARAVRVDKLTIAALSATLALYRDPERALREIPALAMISEPAEVIRQRCELLAGKLRSAGIRASVSASAATVGAGAFPTHSLPSFSVSFEGNAREIEQKLRLHWMPVIGRIGDDVLHLDLRTVPQRDDEKLAEAVRAALS